MRSRNLVAARLAIAAFFIAVGAPARAVIIDFGNLAGANEAPYSGSVEDGFTVAPAAGNWFEAHLFGNPPPSIFAGPVGSVAPNNSLDVARADAGDFTFTSVDLACNNASSCPFGVIGFLDGVEVLSFAGVVTGGPPFVFFTQSNPSPDQVVDALVIGIQPGAGATSMNLDNIVVTPVAVPEPATLALLGFALVALCRGRRGVRR
jgi:hypothetical protein